MLELLLGFTLAAQASLGRDVSAYSHLTSPHIRVVTYTPAERSKDIARYLRTGSRSSFSCDTFKVTLEGEKRDVMACYDSYAHSLSLEFDSNGRIIEDVGLVGIPSDVVVFYTMETYPVSGFSSSLKTSYTQEYQQGVVAIHQLIK